MRKLIRFIPFFLKFVLITFLAALSFSCSVTSDSEYPLHSTVKKGDLEKFTKLLSEGFNVNEKDRYGNTPLHYAVLYGHKDISILLIFKGADVNATSDKEGMTPLHMAVNARNLTNVKMLIEKGAEIDATDKKYGATPLHFASFTFKNKFAGVKIQPPKTEIVENLIELGAKIDVKNSKGFTPLKTAIIHKQEEVVNTLLEMGAYPDNDSDLQSIIDIAKKKGISQIVEMLNNPPIVEISEKDRLKFEISASLESSVFMAAGGEFVDFGEISGTIDKIHLNGRPVPLVHDKIENGFITTKDFGMIKIEPVGRKRAENVPSGGAGPLFNRQFNANKFRIFMN